MRPLSRPIPPLLKLLMETARNDGQILMAKVIGTKSRHWQPMARIPGSLREEIRALLPPLEDVRGQIKKLTSQTKPLRLPDLMEEIEKMAVLVLSGTSLVGGTYIGSQIPTQNIRFFQKGNEGHSVTIHSAARFVLEVTVELCIEIVQKTLDSTLVDRDERNRLNGLKQILCQLKTGLALGADARIHLLRRFARRPYSFTFQLGVDRSNFEMLQNLFKQEIPE